jgi:HEPN domain-containing protein
MTIETEKFMPVMTINYVLALELGIKAMLVRGGNKFSKPHAISKLFYLLDTNSKKKL